MSAARRARTAPVAAAPRNLATGLNQTVYQTLREMIVTLRLAPAESLSELMLVDAIPAGRASVRYAVQRLAAERLLTIIPRGRTLVAPVSITEVQQAYRIRTSLEILAARVSAQYGSAEAMQAMNGTLAACEAALAKGDLVKATRRSRALFAQLAQSSHSDLLTDMLGLVAAISERFEYLVVRKFHKVPFDSAANAALLSALEKRDPGMAEAVVRDRMGDYRARMVADLLGVGLEIGAG